MGERNFVLSEDERVSLDEWVTYSQANPEDVSFSDELHGTDDFAPGAELAIDFLEKAYEIRKNDKNLDKNRVAQLLEDLRNSYLNPEPEIVEEVIATIPLPITVDKVRLNPNRSTRSRAPKTIMRTRNGSFPNQVYRRR